jgi:hypothetical protein
MTKPLDDVAGMIRDARVLGVDETQAMRHAVWPDGVISPVEAGILFELNRASPSPSAEWVDFFVEAITAFLVEQAEPRGYVSDENAAWLMQRIDHDGRIDTLAELELLVRLIERADNVPDDLKAYVLVQVKRAVLTGKGPTRHGDSLTPGRIGTTEVRLLRRVLYAAGGHAPAHISAAEAELLFAIKDATVHGDNAPEWQALFVQALSLHILADPIYHALHSDEAARLNAFMADTSSSVGGFIGRMATSFGKAAPQARRKPARTRNRGVSERKQDWLQAMMDRDGALDPLERALLKALAEG